MSSADAEPVSASGSQEAPSPQQWADRETTLVEAFRNYLSEIEASQKDLLEISRQAIRSALDNLSDLEEVGPPGGSAIAGSAPGTSGQEPVEEAS